MLNAAINSTEAAFAHALSVSNFEVAAEALAAYIDLAQIKFSNLDDDQFLAVVAASLVKFPEQAIDAHALTAIKALTAADEA